MLLPPYRACRDSGRLREEQGDVWYVWSCGRLVLYGISSSLFEAVLRFSVTGRFFYERGGLIEWMNEWMNRRSTTFRFFPMIPAFRRARRGRTRSSFKIDTPFLSFPPLRLSFTTTLLLEKFIFLISQALLDRMVASGKRYSANPVDVPMCRQRRGRGQLGLLIYMSLAT